MKFCHNCYYFLIAITSINSATSGFRTFGGNPLRPTRARISLNARSIRNRRENLSSTPALTSSKLLKLYNTPYDGDEWIRDIPYFMKEKKVELVEANSKGNDILLEDNVSMEDVGPEEMEIFSSPNDGDALNKDKPYFVKEKATVSIKETPVAAVDNNKGLLDEVIISMEEKVVYNSDPDTDNYLVWNTTKQVLRKFADVSACLNTIFLYSSERATERSHLRSLCNSVFSYYQNFFLSHLSRPYSLQNWKKVLHHKSFKVS